jgi:hypothetical protein
MKRFDLTSTTMPSMVVTSVTIEGVTGCFFLKIMQGLLRIRFHGSLGWTLQQRGWRSSISWESVRWCGRGARVAAPPMPI